MALTAWRDEVPPAWNRPLYESGWYPPACLSTFR